MFELLYKRCQQQSYMKQLIIHTKQDDAENQEIELFLNMLDLKKKNNM